jgi:hypothetical protein
MEADDSHQPLLRKGVTTKNTSPRIVSWSICFASLLLFALIQTDRFGVTTSALATLGSTAAKSLFSSHALGKTAAPVENADAPIAGQNATLELAETSAAERARVETELTSLRWRVTEEDDSVKAVASKATAEKEADSVKAVASKATAEKEADSVKAVASKATAEKEADSVKAVAAEADSVKAVAAEADSVKAVASKAAENSTYRERAETSAAERARVETEATSLKWRVIEEDDSVKAVASKATAEKEADSVKAVASKATADGHAFPSKIVKPVFAVAAEADSVKAVASKATAEKEADSVKAVASKAAENSTYRERAETCEAAAREERERYLRIGPSCSGNDVISANRTHLVDKLKITCYELGKTEELKHHFVKRVEECEIEKGRLQQSESKSTAALPSNETTAEEIDSIFSSITDQDTKTTASFLAEAAVAGEKVTKTTATYDAVDVAAACAMALKEMGIDPSKVLCQAKVPTAAPADPSSSGKAGRRRNMLQTGSTDQRPAAIEIEILTTEVIFNALESAQDASTGQAQDPMHILENIPGIDMRSVDSLQNILKGALQKHEDYASRVSQCDAEKWQLQTRDANLVTTMDDILFDQFLLRVIREASPILTRPWLEWSGVTIESGRVVGLNLSGKQLTSLPVEIGLLTSLTLLNLGGNQLTSLPAEIGQLTSLTQLHLEHNQLASVPAEIGQLKSLTQLHLYSNQLTSLPAEIGQLKSLTRLYLEHNQLTSLPAEIGQLKSLTRLYLGDNQLGGNWWRAISELRAAGCYVDGWHRQSTALSPGTSSQ